MSRTMHHCERYKGRLQLMRQAGIKGFHITGFKKDDSDSMTDYHSPADWRGVAVMGLYVLGTDAAFWAHEGALPAGMHPAIHELVAPVGKRNNWWLAKRDGAALVLLASGCGIYAAAAGEEWMEAGRAGAEKALAAAMRAIERDLAATAAPAGGVA